MKPSPPGILIGGEEGAFFGGPLVVWKGVAGICGIAGIWLHEGSVSPGKIDTMLAAMVHRGPDDHGRFTEGRVGLGMRRLAVLDPAHGRQPYVSEDGNVVAVYNGEIYNYPDLAREVEAHGHALNSRTDGEVLVHLYERYGPEMVLRLQGMFAFAIWDRRRHELLLARDPVGQKPLYLWEAGQDLAFASELKAFYRLPGFDGAVDGDLLSAYLAHRFVPAPFTLVRGVTKLEPGQTLRVRADGRRERWTYWRPSLEAPPGKGDLRALGEELDDLLQTVTRSHLAADVPVGIFLSGGLDSSLLAALARGPKPLKAWAARYPEHYPGYDESAWARRVAEHLGIALETVDLGPSVAPEALRELSYHLDEPMADPTAIPLDGLARAAGREETVMLSGEGADELFAGYSGYGEVESMARLRVIPSRVRRLWAERGWPGAGALRRSLAHVAGRYRGVGFTFDPRQQRGLLRPEFVRPDRPAAVRAYWERTGDLPELQAMQGFDVQWFLADDVLLKADRIGMRHNLEVRVPYCDVRIVEFALRMPLALRRNAREDKRVLRAAALAHLPRGVVFRPKSGFPTPLTPLMSGEWRGFAWDLLSDPGARIGEWFERNAVLALVGELAPGASLQARQVYALVMLELWLEEMRARVQSEAGVDRPLSLS